ncbi:MAG: hypothetical protein AAF224_06600 [Pseudomonadota bacterium]
MADSKNRGADASNTTVKGFSLPAPHLTRGGVWLMLRYLAAPLLAALLAFDVLMYFVFRYAFDSCYGVLCLL